MPTGICPVCHQEVLLEVHPNVPSDVNYRIKTGTWRREEKYRILGHDAMGEDGEMYACPGKYSTPDKIVKK